ncbi:hypothetical protein GCM10020221_33520 [Streptomyces thioluteus]|uniref:DUF4188 domain-containing protein n=1 Tax=Streptomyces thioluteus TaxID=66431 RepID=A0ABP6JLZ5_STRTU
MLSAGPREYMVVQYWESREKLLAYARGRGRLHRPAWTAFNRRARAGAGRVGVWHETYVVPAGSHESLYSGMPAYGLGRRTGCAPRAVLKRRTG